MPGVGYMYSIDSRKKSQDFYLKLLFKVFFNNKTYTYMRVYVTYTLKNRFF